MKLFIKNFDFDLPDELIAQQPLADRDSSRLLVLDREGGKVNDRIFRDLPELLRSDDLLVFNDTSVIPAKFFTVRKTGGKIEGLFILQRSDGSWEVMLKGADRCRAGELLTFVNGDGIGLELVENSGGGRWQVRAIGAGQLSAIEILQKVGVTPLPPYIRRRGDVLAEDSADRQRYQTVFAARPGAVAAPTAGLHFTAELLEHLRARGIQTASVTLHVGIGTFAPVKADDISEHKMHQEWYELSADSADKINAALAGGRRIVAVGTTSVRVLESVARRGMPLAGCSGSTDIFIYPPAEFKVVGAMITNFHLPRSTLLMLVSAFCQPGRVGGIQAILDAYHHAVAQRYRFFSYGDAMLIE